MANSKGTLLKYKKYDENGLRKIKVFYDHYIALDEESGEYISVPTKVKKKGGRPGGNPAIANHPKARTGGFDKNPQNIYTGNVGQRIVKDKKLKKEAGILWKENQRECLRTLLGMQRSEVYAYMVLWGMMTRMQCVETYGVDVSEEEFAQLDQSEPTMVQMTCLSMVLKALGDGKFALNILELLEGKAASQAQLQDLMKKSEAEKHEKEVIEPKNKSEIDEALSRLKQDALSIPDEDTETEKEVENEEDFEEPTILSEVIEMDEDEDEEEGLSYLELLAGELDG